MLRDDDNRNPTLNDVVEDYKDYLRLGSASRVSAFEQRLSANPSGAHAEAAVFSWLRAEGLDPTVHEKPGVKSPDFLCSPGDREDFLVEVTVLHPTAVDNQSKWLDKSAWDQIAHHFKMITPSLQAKAKSKKTQVAARPGEMPGVLAICAEHQFCAPLMGTLAVRNLMVSDLTIQVPVAANGENQEPRTATDSRYSAFLEIEEGVIVPVREEISAILLVCIWKRNCEIVGLLHPKPRVEFDYRILPKVPFLRLQWPPLGTELRTEWLVGQPDPFTAPYRHIALTNKELQKQ